MLSQPGIDDAVDMPKLLEFGREWAYRRLLDLLLGGHRPSYALNEVP